MVFKAICCRISLNWGEDPLPYLPCKSDHALAFSFFQVKQGLSERKNAAAHFQTNFSELTQFIVEISQLWIGFKQAAVLQSRLE